MNAEIFSREAIRCRRRSGHKVMFGMSLIYRWRSANVVMLQPYQIWVFPEILHNERLNGNRRIKRRESASSVNKNTLTNQGRRRAVED